MAKTKDAQNFVPVKEVRDGIIIMKDGSIRMILMASSINFALKSQDERTSIIMQFQSFLNSLDFSIQISIQSRKYDIRPYLASLEEREKEQFNELLKIQTRQYMEFIRSFTDSASIMSKTFFVVIPYFPSVFTSSKKTPFSNIFGRTKNNTQSIEKGGKEFEEARSQIEQRASVVSQGLLRSGVRTVRLGTEEVVELLYKMFNPGEVNKPISLRK